MMDTCSDPVENQFFDALEEIAVSSDSGSEKADDLGSVSALQDGSSMNSSAQFDVWIQNPESVQARRSKFFSWLGVDVNRFSDDVSESSCDSEGGIRRVSSSSSGAVSRSTSFEFESSSSSSSVSFCSGDESESSGNFVPKGNCVTGTVETEEVKVHNVVDRNGESGSETSVTVEPHECCLSSSSSGGDSWPVKNKGVGYSVRQKKKVKKWWLSRLRSFNCVMEQGDDPCNCDLSTRTRIQRVKVHQSKKPLKEISALYLGQNIQGHKGPILSMKFSNDGQFLATAGEDRIVRVWKVVEDDRSNEFDVPDMDPSCAYFAMNHLSELKPLSSEKERNGRIRRNSDSACVVIPPKVFRILEKPLHEFRGHTSEILDLSWSKNNCLLSSSVDKTVRLWQIGFEHCLKVFPHNDYVTCVQFNPVNDNYFISGSIDGKVRVWDVSCCKVVYWTEIKDIVTAVCYCPDGKGGIVGSITGSCRFFSISDEQLQLDAPIFLNSKKKSSRKRVTGFQFFPHDPSKVMVSCADSQVRIIQGLDVISKCKGLRSTGMYGSAFFTSDGKHIVSASEDSNIYVRKCTGESFGNRSHMKKVKSFERFLSNASIALPWPGSPNAGSKNRWHNGAFNRVSHVSRSFFSPANFSFGHDSFLESYFPKGSVLWPEEKLLPQSPLRSTPLMHKSDYKFLRTCQSIPDSHVWGMVIVTAGWDGRIRSFHNYGLPVPN